MACQNVPAIPLKMSYRKSDLTASGFDELGLEALWALTNEADSGSRLSMNFFKDDRILALRFLRLN